MSISMITLFTCLDGNNKITLIYERQMTPNMDDSGDMTRVEFFRPK